MSSMSQFFSSAGVPAQYAVVASGSFVTPVAGKYLLTAIGGGGGGSNTATTGRGGGAGGLSQSLVTLAAGVTLTLTVGAAGTTALTGVTGGTTTISGSGITTLTANGGVGGPAVTGAASGGTASGGTLLNVTGGSAGNVNGSGGGAVGVYGVTPDATTTTAGRSIGPFANQVISPPNMFNGRLLQPSAGYFFTASGTDVMNAPGQSSVQANYRSGAFAGASGDLGSGNVGGTFGGGGGARASAGASSAGGVGGVIIEYFIV